MACPKPKPTRMKELEGNPSKKALPKNEPKPKITDTIPAPPSHLNRPAKVEWKKQAAKLHRLGLLTEIDVTMLALYCQAYGRWVEAEKDVAKHGAVITTTNGNVIQSPYVNVANCAMRDCHKYATEFGMSPSSRTKVAVQQTESKSKFAGLIAMPSPKK